MRKRSLANSRSFAVGPRPYCRAAGAASIVGLSRRVRQAGRQGMAGRLAPASWPLTPVLLARVPSARRRAAWRARSGAPACAAGRLRSGGGWGVPGGLGGVGQEQAHLAWGVGGQHLVAA